MSGLNIDGVSSGSESKISFVLNFLSIPPVLNASIFTCLCHQYQNVVLPPPTKISLSLVANASPFPLYTFSPTAMLYFCVAGMVLFGYLFARSYLYCHPHLFIQQIKLICNKACFSYPISGSATISRHKKLYAYGKWIRMTRKLPQRWQREVAWATNNCKSTMLLFIVWVHSHR